MARLLPEQLEFDFFAPPSEQVKKPEKKTVSAAFKDTDILKFQLNKDGSRKLEDFGENLNNTRKRKVGSQKRRPLYLSTASQDEIEERLATESLDRVWPKEAVFDLHKQNPKAAACLWIVRASLNGRRPPKSSSKYGRYKYIASTAIALHRQVVTGELAPEAEIAAFDRFARRGINMKSSPTFLPSTGLLSVQTALETQKAFVQGMPTNFLTTPTSIPTGFNALCREDPTMNTYV